MRHTSVLLHTTCAANSERSLWRRQIETEIAQLAHSQVLPELQACVHNAAIVSGTRPRFEFSSEIESFHHAGFCSSSCRLSVSPRSITDNYYFTIISISGPISAMISTAATAGKNGEVEDPDRSSDGRKEDSADDNVNEAKMIGLPNEIELNCTFVGPSYQGWNYPRV